MAINLISGFIIGNNEPIDQRLILTKEQMLNINEATQPECYFCVCKDDLSFYIYSSSFPEDPETGKFRVLSGGAGSYTLPIASETILGGVKVDGVTITIDADGVIKGVDAYTKAEADALLDERVTPYTVTEAGKILSVNEDGTATEWIDFPEAILTEDNIVQSIDVDNHAENTVISTTGLMNILNNLGELIDARVEKTTVGDLLNLLTVNKDTIVDAINEIDSNVKALSPTETNTEGQVLTVQTDGTVAYQDLPEVDLSVKLDKPEIEGTEGQILTLNADLKPEWVTSSAVPEYTVDDAQKVLTVNASGDGLIWGAGGGDGAGGTADWTTNVALGVLAANTNVTGLTALEILRKATVKYEEPTATVTFSQSNTVIKQGVTFNLDITVKNPVKKTSDIEKFDLYKAGALVESIPYVSGNNSYSFAQIPDVSTDCSYEVRVIDVQGKYSKYTKSYDFVHPIYAGCTDEIPVDATGLTEMIEAKGNKTITVNSGSGAYVVFMYDAAYGDIKNIIDPSGFENITSFTKIQLTINGILYNCYHSNLKQALSNFKYTYKF